MPRLSPTLAEAEQGDEDGGVTHHRGCASRYPGGVCDCHAVERQAPKMLHKGDAEAFDTVYANIQRLKREREEALQPPCDVEPVTSWADWFRIRNHAQIEIRTIPAAYSAYCIACDRFGCIGDHHSIPVTPERIAEIRREFGWDDDEDDGA